MDISHIGAAPVAWPATGWVSRVVIGLAAVLAVAFFAASAFPYLVLRPEALARYLSRREWLLVHVASGTVALLIGPVQLWLGLSRRAMQVDRWLGLTYVTSAPTASVGAASRAVQPGLV